jgi:hypothetical protein
LVGQWRRVVKTSFGSAYCTKPKEIYVRTSNQLEQSAAYAHYAKQGAAVDFVQEGYAVLEAGHFLRPA